MAHLRSLDGLRGLAVLAVVLYHFAPGIMPGGFFGVDVFFVLSGFLITSLLVHEVEGTGKLSLPSFWVRRARRLLPALFLVLAAVALWALFVANQVNAQHAADDGLSAFTYVANWHFIASGQSYIQQFVSQAPSPLRHMWSLAIEEQFYLIWPIVVAAIGFFAVGLGHRQARRRQQFRYAIVIVCGVLGAASLYRMVSLYHTSGDANRVYYGTDTRAYILLVGAALGALTAGAPVIAGRRPRKQVVIGGCIAAAALALAMALTSTSSSWLYQGGYGFVVAAIALVLVAAAQPGHNPLARLFESRALVGLGLISYGVYLWHWPATIWLTEQNTGTTGPVLFAVRSIFTLTASLASYWLIEQPIRQGRLPRFNTANPGVIPMTFVTGVAVLLLVPALAFPSANTVPAVRPSKATGAAAVAYANTPRCDAGLRRSLIVNPKRVELVGNSIGKEVGPCLATLIGSRGDRLETVLKNGVAICGLVRGVRAQVDHPATRPDAAVLFAFPSPGFASFTGNACGATTDWLTAVRQLMGIWKRAGVHVFLVPAIPNPRTTDQARTIGVNSINFPNPLSDYQALVRQDPRNVTLLDGGSFLRDATGSYQWRMPCESSTEVGCAADHTITVRNPDGIHLCAYPPWKGEVCPPADAGGERRVAAVLALQLVAAHALG